MRFVRLSLIAVAGLCLLASTGRAAEPKTFDSDGVTIRYVESGSGEPVILIHGFIASAQLNWIAPGVFDALATDYRVIALDNRGHGQSGKPHDAASYGPQMARDVINLMDHLGIEKAHVAGYSLGGFITTHLIAHYPDRLLSAAPCGAGWTPPGDGGEDFGEVIAKSLESGNGITPLIEALTPAGQPKPPPEQIEQMNAMIVAMNDPLALAACARGLKDLSVTAEALKTGGGKVPVHAIIGEIDPLKAGVDAMAQVLPEMTVTVIAGADHMSAFSDPIFIEALKKHLAAHRADQRTQAPAKELTAAAD
jgi:pimeloyl-ACP methyl ester carboxylesterase